MGRKPPSDPEYAAEGRFQGLIERSSNPRQQAFDHNMARNIRVVQVLAYLALMRQRGIALTGKVVCVGDPPQNFSSSRTMTRYGMPVEPHAAAHILPGKIQIGGTDVWMLARNRETQSAFEFVFSGVEHVPVPFNQADTAAEDKGSPGGLCAAFEEACKAVIRSKIPLSPRGARLNLDLLKLGYDAWERDAPIAIARAIASKGEKPGVPALVGSHFGGYTPESTDARFAAPNKQKNRDAALACLQYYLQDQRLRTWRWVIEECPGRLEEVESRFKG
ncbi:MAG: hypothetical protein WBE72_25415 [Terracidiphilus sp.]